MIRYNCVICLCNLNKTVYTKSFPISFSMSTCKSNFKYEELCIMKCDTCYTLQLKNLIDPKVLYSTSTNHNHNIIGSLWKQHFIKFAEFIHDTNDTYQNVLEIGTTSDKLLKHIKSYETYTIIDPSIKKNTFENYNNTILIDEYVENFNSKHTYDIVLSSHFFEHVLNPSEILLKMKNLTNSNGSIFMSIPNLEYPNCFFGLSFEHTYHININNLNYLCMLHNLKIDTVQKFNNHSLFLKLTNTNNTISTTDLSFHDFSPIIDNQLTIIHTTIKKIIGNLNENTNYFIFGCHSATQVYLTLGLHKVGFIHILDNDTSKHNRYFYGTDLICKPPSILHEYESPVVFIGIGEYSKEVIKQLNIDFPLVTVVNITL